MLHLWRARSVLLLSFAGISLLLPQTCPAQSSAPAEAGVGTAGAVSGKVGAVSGVVEAVSGVVTDPSGARIPKAILTVHNGSFSRTVTADGAGHFALVAPAGSYDLTVAAPGFAAFTTSFTVSAAPLMLNLPLTIAVHAEELAVPVDGGYSTAGADNASALIFRGPELEAFSNDDATFQKELEALGGGGIGGQGSNFIIDGFTGGRLPPKSSILSIRLNRNPYSAVYDSLGFGRFEISTKPGTDKLHGQLNVNATDSAFNALNPYLNGIAQPYYTLNLDGNLNGPIDKKTSFFVSGVYNDQQNNAALNAITVVNGQQTPYIASVRDPQLTATFGLRLDRQVTANNVLTTRYEFNQVTQTNGGLTLPLTLASQAFNSGITSQTFNVTDTQVLGAHMVLDSHAQYIRQRTQQNAVSSAPALLVEGAFNGGGNPSQSLHDNRDRFEFQQGIAIDRGNHYLRFGARYRLSREGSLSTANYNGQYVFPSIGAYQASTPSFYTQTVGQPSASLLTGDLAAFAEDEWKLTKSITLDLGFRLESQSAIPDHLNPAPRLGAAWALHRKGQKATFLTLRSGGGIFYNRFAASDLLTSIRQNGVTQQTYQLTNPCYNANGSPAAAPCNQSLTVTPPTVYRISPTLKAEYGWSGGLTVEKNFGKLGTASVNYVTVRGVHQYDSRNINAPLPGTYNPAVPGSGTRPFGGTQNMYEFDSGGIQKSQVVFVNSRLNLGKRANLFLNYDFVHTRQDTNGADNFPSNSYNLSQDYGQPPQATQQLFTGGTLHLPLHLDLNLFAATVGGIPFNITTGTDLNGDTIFNDRPAYATHPTANSVIYNTRYGSFDANPQTGEAIIPIDLGKSPNFVFLDLSASRTFKLGTRPPAKTVAAGAKPAPRPDPPYSLSFTVDGNNLINHRNPGQPVGVLSSPLFGQSISLNSAFTPNTASNRAIFLQMGFGF